MGLHRKDAAGSAAGRDRAGRRAARIGRRTGRGEPRATRRAIAAAFGAAADAVAVTGIDAAVAAFDHLKTADLGRAGVLLGRCSEAPDRHDWPALPDGARYAVDVVEAPDALRAAVRRVLRKVAVVDDLAAARALIADAARGGGGDPRRRRAQRLVRRRRVLRAAQPDRGAGRGRRRRDADWPRRTTRSTGCGSRRASWRAATARPSAGSRWPWPGCTSPTRRWPRWPRSSVS